MLSKNKMKFIRSLELKKRRKEEHAFVAEGGKTIRELLGRFHCRLLAATPVGFRSIYLSTPPAWIAACLITVLRFRKGAWKEKQIIS